jgi:hypothetical protein
MRGWINNLPRSHGAILTHAKEWKEIGLQKDLSCRAKAAGEILI